MRKQLFAFPGFNASSKLVGKFGDRYARVIQLKRRKKQPSVVTVVSAAYGRYDKISRCCGYEHLSVAGPGESTWSSNAGVSDVRGVLRRACRTVLTGWQTTLAIRNALTMHVVKLCSGSAEQGCCRAWNACTHSTVKDLDKLYMQKQVDLAGLPAPRAIGIDEISIRKGHNYSGHRQ